MANLLVVTPELCSCCILYCYHLVPHCAHINLLVNPNQNASNG